MIERVFADTHMWNESNTLFCITMKQLFLECLIRSQQKKINNNNNNNSSNNMWKQQTGCYRHIKMIITFRRWPLFNGIVSFQRNDCTILICSNMIYLLSYHSSRSKPTLIQWRENTTKNHM